MLRPGGIHQWHASAPANKHNRSQILVTFIGADLIVLNNGSQFGGQVTGLAAGKGLLGTLLLRQHQLMQAAEDAALGWAVLLGWLC